MAHLRSSVSLFKFLIYYFSLLLLLFNYFPEETQAIFHKVEISYIPPTSVCSRPNSTGPNTLELVNKNGPCSPHYDPNKNKPSLADILLHDQSRLNSIQALQNQYKDSKAILTAYYGYGDYVVTVGLGTPPQNQTLMLDTSSFLTWAQCKPCLGYCYRQLGPLYSPYSSCTYSNILCNSSECSNLGYDIYCYDGPCVYNIQYGDASYSVGMLSKEKLTVTSAAADDVFTGFVFGCGQKNKALSGEAAGFLGLGKNLINDGLTFLNQTAGKYRRSFSYCFPSNDSSAGYLKFGRNDVNSKDVMFTPLLPDTFFYLVEIVSISVGGTQLPIRLSSFQSTMVDSGMTFTQLPQDAYNAMKDEFKEQMKMYPSAPNFDPVLDTCFDLGNASRTIEIPGIIFTFKGGAKVDLDGNGIMVPESDSVWCLAFAGNGEDDGQVVFGSTQQKTFEVVYDVAGGKLGFRPNGC